MDAIQSDATSEIAGSAPASAVGFRGEGLAATGGVAGALAAIGCCILPLALFSLGVGWVWVGRLASLAPYQPWFIGFAAVSIGYGFWQVYRRPGPVRADGSACARPLPKRRVTTAPWSATVVGLAATISPVVIPSILLQPRTPVFNSSVCAVSLPAALAAPALAGQTETLKLFVPGMTGCPSCPYIIQSALGRVDGVSRVEAVYATGIATIVYDDEAATLEDFMKVLEDYGYDYGVELVEPRG